MHKRRPGQIQKAPPRVAARGHDDRTRLLALTAEVGAALTTRRTLPDMLDGCAEAFVHQLGAAFARIWTLDEAQEVLVLRASAGMYTHLDGPHGRVPVGKFKIGLIAQERRPHLTNAVVGDPRVGDQEWAKREGMVAFAGYPLVLDERLIGVVALFSRSLLSDLALEAMASVADQIAVGIDRKRAEEALRASEARYRAAFAHAAVGVTLADLEDRCLEANAAFCAITGYTEAELQNRDFLSLTFPADRAETRALMQRLRAGEISSFVAEKRYVRKDGQSVWVQNSVALIRDAEGRPANTIALTEDISERKDAAARRQTFSHDMLLSVTDGVLRLCETEADLPPPAPLVAPPTPLEADMSVAALRRLAVEAARQAGMEEQQRDGLAIAVGEAAMNALRHARGGEGCVGVGSDGVVQVQIRDRGDGIALERLPQATLLKGYSSAGTLGHGMKFMIQSVDRLYLLTGRGGTTVVIEQARSGGKGISAADAGTKEPA